MMISIPPKYAVSQVIAYTKSAIHLARVYERKLNFIGQHFWVRRWGSQALIFVGGLLEMSNLSRLSRALLSKVFIFHGSWHAPMRRAKYQGWMGRL